MLITPANSVHACVRACVCVWSSLDCFEEDGHILCLSCTLQVGHTHKGAG